MAPVDLSQVVTLLGKYLDLNDTELLSKDKKVADAIKDQASGDGAQLATAVSAPTAVAPPVPSVPQGGGGAAAAAPAPIVQIPQAGTVTLAAAPAPKGRSAWVQWSALFAGIAIQPFFQAYQAHHSWSFEGVGGWTLFALITSIVIFPGVYKRAFDQDSPVLVQLAPIFTAGLGWQSLLTTAIKLVT